MALVTLFFRGGHAGDAGVELDCTCGCEDVCAPVPVVTSDVTPFDNLSNEPVPLDTCGADVAEPSTDTTEVICATNADCTLAGSECTNGTCFCPNGVVCVADVDCTGDVADAYCHGDGVCMVPCSELP